MLVTILVVCFLRPVLRCPIQRQKTISIVLIGAWLVSSPCDLTTGFAQATSNQRDADPTEPAQDDSISTDSAAGSDSSAARKRLREGTSIPPTIGHIVKLGRRWAFLPIDSNSKTDHQASLSEAAAETPTYATSASADDFGTRVGRPIPPIPLPAVDDRFQQERSVRARKSQSNDSLSTDRIDSIPGNDSANHHGEDGTSRLMILCENQMLQRIVEASDTEDSDDRWQISGEILEYFNQNRLLIRTIQRASTPLDSPRPVSTP